MKFTRPFASILILAVIALLSCLPFAGMMSANTGSTVCGQLSSHDFHEGDSQGKLSSGPGCPAFVISSAKSLPESGTFRSNGLETGRKVVRFRSAPGISWPIGRSPSISMASPGSLYRQSVLLLI